MTLKVAIITQARMTSTRLPKKVLMKILDKTLLEFHLERLQKIKQKNSIIVATTTNNTDDAIVNLCQKNSVMTYRGSEDDVLKRYYEAALQDKADVIVRVTSDCPLLDPDVIDFLITQFLKGDYDYVANFYNTERTYPLGLEAEVFSFKVLEKANSEANQKLHREHVTPFIWQQPEIFKHGIFQNNENYSDLRLTVDTKKDFELIQNILKEMYPDNPDFRLKDIIGIFKKHPDWKLINKEIKHKYYS